MKAQISRSRLAGILTYAIVAIFILLPFHAVFTTWLGANFGHIDLFRIWKELLLVPLGLGALMLISKRKLPIDEHIQAIIYLMVGYALLHISLGLVALTAHRVNASALIYALLINIRFFVFFVVCYIVALETPHLRSSWQKFVLIPAVLVIVFGLMQQFVLPANILTHVGYGPATTPAYQTIDQKPDYTRIQSTLRGPNPLGAYLVVILSSIIALYIRSKKYRGQLIIFGLATTVLLIFTYSRSAWLGTALSVGLVVYWTARNQKVRRWTVLVAGLSILILGGVVLVLRNNDVLQNTLFHTDETSRSSESSNAVRTQALTEGAKSILREPIGRGPGTAGPASFRNVTTPRIAENYFVQIAQEVGVIGLALFLAINVLVFIELWQRRTDQLAVILLAGLAGLMLVNMISHAWADDTLSLIFWGLAGLAIAPVILEQKAKAL